MRVAVATGVRSLTVTGILTGMISRALPEEVAQRFEHAVLIVLQFDHWPDSGLKPMRRFGLVGSGDGCSSGCSLFQMMLSD